MHTTESKTKTKDREFDESHLVAQQAIAIFKKEKSFKPVLEQIYPVSSIGKKNWLESLIWREREGLDILKRGLLDLWYWEENIDAKRMLDMLNEKTWFFK